jgi:hypothetical protein
MKTIKWLLIIFIGLLGCSKSTPDPAFGGDTNASLNAQAWGGFSTTWKNPGDSCGINAINLSIENKLPYPKARLQAPALCAGYCGDQSLTFIRIPLAVGVYTLSTPQPCRASTNQVGVSFTTLIGGDIIRDKYQLDLTKPATIKITKYDPQAGKIEGTFDVSLVRDNSRQATSDAAETINFRNGLFRAKLP